MPAYTVVSVQPNPRPWNSTQGGPMLGYRMTVRDVAGQEIANVEWSRKITSAAPQPGQQIEGTIDMAAQYGPKFKQAQQGSGGGGGGGYSRSPEETAAIQRQHSQKVALMYVQAKAAAGVLPSDFKPADLVPIIDFFERDIANSTKLRDGAQTGQAA